MNVIFLKGNLTADPELRYAASGTAVCSFTLAVNKQYTDKRTGEMRKKVLFVKCTSFGKRGEVISKHFTKGAPILVQGELEIDAVDASDGSGKKYYTKILVNSFEFCGGSRGSGASVPLTSSAGGGDDPGAYPVSLPSAGPDVGDGHEWGESDMSAPDLPSGSDPDLPW